ncbi:MAG: amidohydrolase family protein [Proteobacteria bacterium]|nr:amidohydrolase family protein [Pseudomonadota bacterium]
MNFFKNLSVPEIDQESDDMRLHLLLVFSVIICCSGCSAFGGGHSNKNPLKMKMKDGLSPIALEIVDQAFDIGNPVVDHHLHVIGEKNISSVMAKICPDYAAEAKKENGGKEIDSRAWVNEDRFSLNWFSLKRLGLFLKTKVLMDTMKIEGRKNTDIDSANRLLNLVKGLVEDVDNANGYDLEIYLLAVDGYYEKGGYGFDEKYTDIYVPNNYVVHLSRCLNSEVKGKSPFVPVISINPNRADAVKELTKYKDVARYIKWLAPAMGFDPLDPYIDPFLEKVKEYGMVIISHSGGEHAFDIKDESFRKFGDPLRLVKALDKGIPVVVSHSGGDDDDKRHRNMMNFFKMLEDDRNKDKWCLFGDTSALTLPKNLSHFDKLLEDGADKYKYRILYGSDYPLPAVWKMNPIDELVSSHDHVGEDGTCDVTDRAEDRYIHNKFTLDGFPVENSKKVLRDIFSYNPLAFDVVVKRILHRKGKDGPELPAEMFMSLEENIRREQEDKSVKVKRKQCLNWYNNFGSGHSD